MSIGAGKPQGTSTRLNAAYYADRIDRFLVASDDTVYAALSEPHGLPLTAEQLVAWKRQLPILREALRETSGWIHLEFDIPRLGRRVDAVVVTGPAIIPIEFKVGSTSFDRADYEQAWDYGLDLKNFHAPSHAAPIFPVLCATDAADQAETWKPAHPDGVRPPLCCNATRLSEAIRRARTIATGPQVDADAWGSGRYSPTPTIIEAARSLYSRHTVHDITKSDADATNISVTSDAIEHVIADARARGRKAIVFVTGVPGAGKTLVGLNIATRHGAKLDATHSVFLSGNGPLVAVLREALARDEYFRRRAAGEDCSKSGERQKVKAFIQEVRHFVKDVLRERSAACPAPPDDHVIVFDEAQRAWDARHFQGFMRRRYGLTDLSESQSGLLIGAMDRHQDWSVVVCLVGNGQEINTGEAGIGAWIDSVNAAFPAWDVYISPSLHEAEIGVNGAIERLGASRAPGARVLLNPALHLSTSMRSFRAEHLSRFVQALLDGEEKVGRELFGRFQDRYPIVLTRSMRTARRWVRSQCRGSERVGLVASSSAERLKPHAVDVRVNVDPIHWFLAPSSDTRSSQYLEDAATEFLVQGLEMDWSVVAWDADLRRSPLGWEYHGFRGSGWVRVNKPERRNYLKNAYRVLLTRARQGMVIFVPPGRKRDRTRKPEYYEGVYEYLKGFGVPEIS